MGNYDAEIRVSTKVETSQMQKLQMQIDKAVDKVDSLTKKYDELKNKKIPTQGYKEVQKQIENTEKKISDLTSRQEKFLATGGKVSSSAYKRMEYDLEELRNSLPYLKGELQDLVEEGKAFTIGDSEEINKTANELAKAKSELRMLVTKQNELEAKSVNVSDGLKKIGKTAKKAFGEVGNEVKKSSGLFSAFVNRLKSIALSALIFNGISKIFSSFVTGMKKGFENLMGYSNAYAQSIQNMKNSMSTLGNQIAAAFAPIVQMVIPWLTSLINVISAAIEYVSRFFAILTGKSSYTRAKRVQDSYGSSLGGTAKKEKEVADNADDMSDALDDTTKSAKKAKGVLAAFDDLDVLEKQDENADNAALDKIKDIKDAAEDLGGAGGGLDDLFEEVPIDNELPNWLENILDYLKKLKDIFMEGFWDGLGDWEYRVESIKDSLALIKDSLIDIFTDPAVLSAADGWAQSVAYKLGSLVGSLASIGLTIAANLLGGIASYLEDNKDRIKDYFVSMFDVQAEINYMLADFFQSFAYVFEAFASEGGIQLTANLIGIFADAFMGITELASKIARDILNIFIQPFVDNKEAFRTALEGFLSVLAEVTGTIKQGIDDTFDKLNEVYDKHFKPFFDSVAQGLSDLTGQFLDFWNGKVQPILYQWAVDFDTLWTGHIQPLLDNVAEFFGKIADLLMALWENILQPLIAWIIDNILPRLLPIFDAMWTAIVNLVGYIADLANSVFTIFGGIIDFLTGVFSGNWDKAFQGLLDIGKGFIDYLKDSIEGGIVLIADLVIEKLEELAAFMPECGANIVQGIIDGINSLKEKAKEAITEIADGVKEWFAEKLGIHSPSTVMEEQGYYIIEGLLNGIMSKINLISELWNGLKEDMITAMQGIGEWFFNFWASTFDNVSVILQNIQLFFLETWTAIYETIIEVWTGIQEWFSEFWLIFTENLYIIWEDIILFFTETWENITLIFQTFIDFINATVIPIWQESWTTAQNIFQLFRDSVTNIVNLIKTLFTEFFQKFVKNIIDVNWKDAWENAKKIFTAFKDKVSEVIEMVRGIIQSFFDWAMGLINSILSAIENIGSAISGIFGGGGGNGGSGGGGGAPFSMARAVSEGIPALASGAVIRGGNPYMAILGDQPRGQTNVEAPLDTIKQAVREEMSGMNFGTGSLNADMTLDGETVGRLLVPYIIDEMIRQGYDVDILGVT